ncbi:MAG: YihA family ribosome biogenesis GTP-binding protein [Chromatiaceae bacterium]|nr:YihA family ribosome biogenesis GTP-binding protein [Chromatiaceae bacterium]
MNSHYRQAAFLRAVARLDQAPEDTGREVAFAGRSNAGKSSAINTICDQRHLARTSKTPGRTQQIVFFETGEGRRLVDLPGYGYARVSEAIKLQWQDLMADYLRHRQSLIGLVVVMDIRHPLTDFDLRMLDWSRETHLSLLLLLTKSDKLKRGAAMAQADLVRRAVAKEGDRIRVERFSSFDRQGVEPVHEVLDQWLGVAG